MKNNFITKIIGVTLAFAMMIGGAVGINATKQAKEVNAAEGSATYRHVFNAKPSTGNNVTLSTVKWNIEATNLGSYNSGNYAGVQLGTSSKNGSITLTSSSTWGEQADIAYSGKTVITEVRLWLNLGGTSVTPSVTIGGVSAISDGTTVVKNSSAGSDYTKATKVTFTPAINHDTGVVVVGVTTVKAGYICALEIDCEEPSGTSKSVQANSVSIKTGSTLISGSYEPAAPYYIGETLDLTASTVAYEQGEDFQDGQGLINWESSNTTVATIDDGIVTFVGAGTSTITATSVDKGENDSDVTASFTLDISDATYRPGTVNNPYTVAQALAASPSNGVYVTGIVSTITEVSTSHGNATYRISDDGSTTDEMIIYRGKYTNNVAFAHEHQIQLGDTVVVTGNLTVYQEVNQLAQNNYITSLTPVGFSITYNDNGADSGTVPVDANEYQRDVASGLASAIAKTNEGNLTKTGYLFTGWNTHADPTANGATHYDIGEEVSISGNTTLYADWLSTAPSIIVQANLSGYTTGNTNLDFTYGNIADTSKISVVASNDNVTVGNISADAGSGSVEIGFNRAGNASLSFRNDGDELATCTVTVNQSTVTITGLPATKSLYTGRNLDLGSQIEVEKEGAYTTAVTWESDDETVATVSDVGVVSAIAAGTANITVTAVSDENVSMTCAITVSQMPPAYDINFGSTRNTNPSEIDTDQKFKDAYSFDGSEEVTISGFKKVYGTNSTNMLKLGSNSSSASITFTIPSKYYISSVEITVSYAGGTSLDVKSGATGAQTENQSITVGTLIFDDYFVSEKSNSVTISSTANGAFYLTNITIIYAKTAREAINTEVFTQTMLSYHYTDNGNGGFNYSNIVVRFSGFISQELWAELDTNSHVIDGFGIMLAETDELTDVSIKEWYETALEDASGDVDAAILSLNSFIKNVSASVGQNSPASANEAQKQELGVDVNDNYYIWNGRKSISADDIEKEYTSVAYIRIDNELVFLREITTSVKQIANNLLDNDIYASDAFDGSLYKLAHFGE